MNTIKTLLAAAIAFYMSVPAHADEKRPNIIFIMADDLGNADLGYRGGQIQSPTSTRSRRRVSGSSRSTASRCARRRGRR